MHVTSVTSWAMKMTKKLTATIATPTDVRRLNIDNGNVAQGPSFASHNINAHREEAN